MSWRRKKYHQEATPGSILDKMKGGKKITECIFEIIDPVIEKYPDLTEKMRTIAFIEEQAVIEKILKHLGLWLINSRSPPRKPASRICVDLPEFPRRRMVSSQIRTTLHSPVARKRPGFEFEFGPELAPEFCLGLESDLDSGSDPGSDPGSVPGSVPGSGVAGVA